MVAGGWDEETEHQRITTGGGEGQLLGGGQTATARLGLSHREPRGRVGVSRNN